MLVNRVSYSGEAAVHVVSVVSPPGGGESTPTSTRLGSGMLLAGELQLAGVYI